MERFLRTVHETSDVEIENAMKDVPGFLGVVDRTQIGRIKIEPGESLIVNIDGHYRNGGTHWVALVRSSEVPLYYYFCSYGGQPVAEATLKARRDNLGLVYSDVKYQTLDESNCGQRSARVIYDLARGRERKKELETFLKIAGYHTKGRSS